METIWQNILTGWLAQSQLEVMAVLASILYLVLVMRQNIWCWFFAFISTAIYIFLFHEVSLFSESLLNVFYLLMAIYGWWQWRGGRRNSDHLSIVKWSWQRHLKLIVVTGLFVPVLGYYMQIQGADFAYWDAFTSCFAVLTTFLVVWKVFENWYYWLVIDAISVVLFWLKDLPYTATLFIVYLVLVIIGIKQWSEQYDKQIG